MSKSFGTESSKSIVYRQYSQGWGRPQLSSLWDQHRINSIVSDVENIIGNLSLSMVGVLKIHIVAFSVTPILGYFTS